jgi:hypothetical protein
MEAVAETVRKRLPPRTPSGAGWGRQRGRRRAYEEVLFISEGARVHILATLRGRLAAEVAQLAPPRVLAGIVLTTILGWRKLNALSGAVVSQLSTALAAAERDDEVKVVVLAGAEAAFSVGYDIAEDVALGVDRADERHAAPDRVTRHADVARAILWR